MFSKPFKIGIFVSVRYSSFFSDAFIGNVSKNSILCKGLKLGVGSDTKYQYTHSYRSILFSPGFTKIAIQLIIWRIEAVREMGLYQALNVFS